jgi:hypothetical protein
MVQVNPPSSGHRRSTTLTVRLFTPVTAGLWAAVVVITILAEVIPIPLIAPVPFYFYCAAKLLCFVVLGYLAPLALQGFNALNRGILLATVSATCVESFQGWLHRGHSFHWYELIVKLGLILIGFALALDARYERQMSVGRIHIRLTGPEVE